MKYFQVKRRLILMFITVIKIAREYWYLWKIIIYFNNKNPLYNAGQKSLLILKKTHASSSITKGEPTYDLQLE